MNGRGREVTVLATGAQGGLHEEEVKDVRVLRVGLVDSYWHYRTETIPAWRRAVWHIRDIYNPTMGGAVRDVVHMAQPDVVSCHNLAGWSAAAWEAVK